MRRELWLGDIWGNVARTGGIQGNQPDQVSAYPTRPFCSGRRRCPCHPFHAPIGNRSPPNLSVGSSMGASGPRCQAHALKHELACHARGPHTPTCPAVPLMHAPHMRPHMRPANAASCRPLASCGEGPAPLTAIPVQ